MTTGLVLGKFLPPHAGHLFLIDFALAHADRVFVVVGTLESEPIAGELRYRWMQELAPRAEVIHLSDELPQHPSEDSEFWSLWQAALRRVLPAPVERVFASEAYGEPLAEILDARFIPVDQGRAALPVSGTAVRDDPLGHWEYLPPCVRAHYAHRVCVFGPESTGKTTLARRLAAELDTAWVPEYARTLIESRSGELTAADIEPIARGQMAYEDALARRANRVLIADTDLVATVIWAETLYGHCPRWISEEASRRQHDLYLLCDVDVPWVPDIARCLPDERGSFFRRCRHELDRRGCRVVEIRGDWDLRWQTAVTATREQISRRAPATG